MRKIINRKVYDTDTAKRVCTSYCPYGRTDHSFKMWTLFQKRTGEYFFTYEDAFHTEIVIEPQFLTKNCPLCLDDNDQYIDTVQEFIEKFGRS